METPLQDILRVKEAQRDKAKDEYERFRHECNAIRATMDILSTQKDEEPTKENVSTKTVSRP